MIELWMIFIIVAIIAIVIEIFAPTMFCINFAFAGIITAIISIFWGNLSELIWIFLILSVLSIFFVKPILVKLIKKETSTDFDSQYIGKIVKVIEPITKTKGAVTIYDERWEARLQYDTEEIPVDSDVKIVANDSLILFVEKV
jgi:membrane protein implicated in regulation of membrane protease activity